MTSPVMMTNSNLSIQARSVSTKNHQLENKENGKDKVLFILDFFQNEREDALWASTEEMTTVDGLKVKVRTNDLEAKYPKIKWMRCNETMKKFYDLCVKGYFRKSGSPGECLLGQDLLDKFHKLIDISLKSHGVIQNNLKIGKISHKKEGICSLL